MTAVGIMQFLFYPSEASINMTPFNTSLKYSTVVVSLLSAMAYHGN